MNLTKKMKKIGSSDLIMISRMSQIILLFLFL